MVNESLDGVEHVVRAPVLLGDLRLPHAGKVGVQAAIGVPAGACGGAAGEERLHEAGHEAVVGGPAVDREDGSASPVRDEVHWHDRNPNTPP